MPRFCHVTDWDVCFEHVEPCEKKVLSWCQGEAIVVSNGKNLRKSSKSYHKAGAAVKIRWDSSFVEDESETSIEELKPSKWNPENHSNGSWRHDVAIP